MALRFLPESSVLRSSANCGLSVTTAMWLEPMRLLTIAAPKRRPPMRIGMRIVMIRKLLAWMRSRYSRFAMSHTLRIGFASYGFDEDLFEGGFHHLKVVDVGAVFDRGCEKMLRGGIVVKLDLRVAGVVFG